VVDSDKKKDEGFVKGLSEQVGSIVNQRIKQIEEYSQTVDLNKWKRQPCMLFSDLSSCLKAIDASVE